MSDVGKSKGAGNLADSDSLTEALILPQFSHLQDKRIGLESAKPSWGQLKGAAGAFLPVSAR